MARSPPVYAPRGHEHTTPTHMHHYTHCLTPIHIYTHMLYFYSTPDLPISIYLTVVILLYWNVYVHSCFTPTSLDVCVCVCVCLSVYSSFSLLRRQILEGDSSDQIEHLCRLRSRWERCMLLALFIICIYSWNVYVRSCFTPTSLDVCVCVCVCVCVVICIHHLYICIYPMIYSFFNYNRYNVYLVCNFCHPVSLKYMHICTRALLLLDSIFV